MSFLSFIKPEKIILQKSSDNHGLFEFKPLEPGFGVTVGNALRRVLLSSLEGHAIAAIKISGVDHEFSTIDGIIEDVTEIILNLKQVRLKKLIDDNSPADKIYLSISGKEAFNAGMIERHTNVFKVVNPDQHICSMDPSVTLEIEMIIARGRGYTISEDQNLGELALGFITVDSIFTPIRNVRYSINNVRVEQRTDFEALELEVVTDGTIHPEDAVKEGARLLIQHLRLISDENFSFGVAEKREDEFVDEHVLQMRKLLKTNLEDLDLSVRAYNCLKAAKINTLEELVHYNTNELLKFRNFGRKSLVEIEALLVEQGLSFGMDISKYQIED